MADLTIPLETEEAIDALVTKFSGDLETFSLLAGTLRVLVEKTSLASLIHSYKIRVKEPESLRDKLRRKWRKAYYAGVPFDITSDNLYEKINDLAGLRLLHLHTLQFPAIRKALEELFEEYLYTVREGPTARTWDDEYRSLFSSLNVAVVGSEGRLYTSIHYVIEPNQRSKLTAEIQVRTLAEELWGEVDHSINYPHASLNLAAQEQIKVLARVTSSCTRLVDAIFRTNSEP